MLELILIMYVALEMYDDIVVMDIGDEAAPTGQRTADCLLPGMSSISSLSSLSTSVPKSPTVKKLLAS